MSPKRKQLEAHGWKIGSARDFLEMADAEAALIELRLVLARGLRDRRTQHGWSQLQLARRLKSSQSRVAKMEAGDPSVSIDLLVRSLFALGAGPRDLARTIRQMEDRAAV